jgi:hypothetical protein
MSGTFSLKRSSWRFGELDELRELLLCLAVLGREHVLGDLGNLLLLQVPEQVTRPVFTG